MFRWPLATVRFCSSPYWKWLVWARAKSNLLTCHLNLTSSHWLLWYESIRKCPDLSRIKTITYCICDHKRLWWTNMVELNVIKPQKLSIKGTFSLDNHLLNEFGPPSIFAQVYHNQNLFLCTWYLCGSYAEHTGLIFFFFFFGSC